MREAIYVLLIVLAVVVVQTANLKRAIIYLGILSLCCSLAYLLLSAPDVALAEAVIASTLSTILFLVALQKYNIFNIYYVNPLVNEKGVKTTSNYNTVLLDAIEEYCHKKGLDPHLIISNKTEQMATLSYEYDLIIHQLSNNIWVYGRSRNYQVNNITALINEMLPMLKEENISVEIDLY